MLRAMWARVEIAEQAQKGMRNIEEEEAARERDEIRWSSGMRHQTISQQKTEKCVEDLSSF